MNEIKGKITAAILLVFVILATTLVGIAQAASYRGSWRKPPAIASFEVILQTWPDMEYNANPPTKSYLTDEGDLVIKNFRCHGIPPLIDDLGSITMDDYPNGGISLTIDGEYTLKGTIDRRVKINIFYGFDPWPPEGVYAVGKWTFEITEVASGTAPDNAVGSTISGWYAIVEGVQTYESTKGTGMFHGASMVFTLSTTPVMVEGRLFAHETAAGDMLFP